jgi:acyl carrier protein
MRRAILEINVRNLINEVACVNLIANESLRDARIDSVDMIALENQLEQVYQLENPNTLTWLNPDDTIETIVHKIENWKTP